MGWPAVKEDDFCSRFERKTGHAPVVDDSMRQLAVMGKQLTNGYPILPLPENIAAFRLLLNEKAPSDTAANHSAG